MERKTPPVLSNLDPILTDEGFYGVKLAIEDNLTTGRFVGHDYKASFHRVSLNEKLNQEFEKLIDKGHKIFIVDLTEDEIFSLKKLRDFDQVLIFNVRSKSDSLRNEKSDRAGELTWWSDPPATLEFYVLFAFYFSRT